MLSSLLLGVGLSTSFATDLRADDIAGVAVRDSFALRCRVITRNGDRVR